LFQTGRPTHGEFDSISHFVRGGGIISGLARARV